MTSLRRTEEIHNLKVRQLTYQAPDGGFPSPGSLLNVASNRGLTSWTSDLSINSITVNNIDANYVNAYEIDTVNLNISGDLNIYGDTHTRDLYVEGKADVAETLDVSGEGRFYSDIYVRGRVIVGADITRDIGSRVVEDVLVVRGTANIESNITAGTLSVTGQTRFDSDVEISGNMSVSGDIVVSGSMALSSGMTLPELTVNRIHVREYVNDTSYRTSISTDEIYAKVIGIGVDVPTATPPSKMEIVGGVCKITGANVEITNNLAVGGTLAATGQTTLTGLTAGVTTVGALTTTAAQVNGPLGVTGQTTLGGLSAGTTTVGALTATSGQINGSLGVTGQTTLDGLTAGATSVGALTATSGQVNGALNVTGQSTLSEVTAGTTSVGALTATTGQINGVLGVTGQTTLVGLTAGTTSVGALTATSGQINGTLGVTGQTTLAGLTAGTTSIDALTATSGQINGTLGVTGQTTLAGLTAGTTSVGALTATSGQINGTLGVTGQTTLAGLTAGTTSVGALTATSGQVNGTLGVTGQTTLAGLTAGATSVGALTVTNAQISQNISISGELTTSVIVLQTRATPSETGLSYDGFNLYFNGMIIEMNNPNRYLPGINVEYYTKRFTSDTGTPQTDEFVPFDKSTYGTLFLPSCVTLSGSGSATPVAGSPSISNTQIKCCVCSFWFKPTAGGAYYFRSENDTATPVELRVNDTMLIYVNGQIVTKRYYSDFSLLPVNLVYTETPISLNANNYYKVDIFYFGRQSTGLSETYPSPSTALRNENNVPSITWTPNTGTAYTTY
jgi:hypothetical protein